MAFFRGLNVRCEQSLPIGSGHLSASACKDACAPSPAGCLKCETVRQTTIPANTSAVLFGARDAEAAATLRSALDVVGFACVECGPLLMVQNLAHRVGELGTHLSKALSRYTQSCIQAAYMPSGVENVNQMLGAMAFAMPLAQMIENIEHEWVREGLNENWLFSVFHPIIRGTTGEVYANEALLRAKNPSTGQVLGAGQIINACERLNLLHVLDQRARQSAIRAAAEHVPGPSRIFINFLPNTIYDPEICLRTTMEAAAKYGVPMARLVFEVVETQKIPDMDHLCKVLNYYRERGVGTAIDDMGAGFTGVDYITSLQPDFVKLDREFVLEAEQTLQGRRTMESLISTSHAHGARVIAEGIETPAQMSMCVNAGVDFLQGFLFAKPACPPQAAKFPTTKLEAA
jgi:EAL domain-containing protein (putative c-di-GMP-specific phosphodiesterase class I)